jgi:hypothetical protein
MGSLLGYLLCSINLYVCICASTILFCTLWYIFKSDSIMWPLCLLFNIAFVIWSFFCSYKWVVELLIFLFLWSMLMVIWQGLHWMCVFLHSKYDHTLIHEQKDISPLLCLLAFLSTMFYGFYCRDLSPLLSLFLLFEIIKHLCKL